MNKDYKTFEELKEELGDKFEEFMYKANIELLEKVNQLETNRDEAIRYIKAESISFLNIAGQRTWCGKHSGDKILEILERGKEIIEEDKEIAKIDFRTLNTQKEKNRVMKDTINQLIDELNELKKGK